MLLLANLSFLGNYGIIAAITDDEKLVLFPGKKVYTIGRLATDLIVAQDLSISRNHAQLLIQTQADGDDSLHIEDLGSRYGTFIFPKNSQKPRKVPAKTSTPLPVGTRLRFGANMSIWQVTQLKLVTTVSALTRPEVQELTKMLEPMGGTVTSNWTDECSHLTMNEVSVTVKLLHAMLENKPIVTFPYWRKMLQAAQSIHVKEGWPQPEDYQPTNIDVTWRPERTRLFAGKTFVFMNRKHFDMYGSVVQKAGATCKDINSGVRKTFLTKSDVIVIQYVPSSQSQATESINSIQEFCNPTHKFISDSLPTTESVTSSMAFNSSIIVPNTERDSAQSNATPISELVVPESIECEMEPNASKPNSEPQASLRKRSHASTVDSSDEEKKSTLSKRAKSEIATKLTMKSKNAILLDSSLEEDVTPAPAFAPGQRVTSRSKAIAEEKSVHPSVPAASKHITRKTKQVFCVDSSDEENENARESKETPAPTIPSLAKKKTEAPAATRISPRLNGKSLATNITNQQADKHAVPQKRPVLSVTSCDEEDEGDLFQFRKSPQKQTESVVQPRSASKSQAPARISVVDFLEKSQAQEPAPVPPQLESQSQTQPRKRLRLELLNESDSDDCDNLFNFADSKKKRKTQEVQKNDDSTDGLFNFNSERPSDHDDEDSRLTEPFVPETESKKQSKYIVAPRRDRPKKVDISGWLSCSRLNDDIKSEIDADSVKMETSIKADPDEEQWLAAMKDSIEVRMCNLNIVIRSQEEVDASLEDSVNKHGGRKNFKKFVKTKNPHPQKRIVALKSLRLADGMVTCV
ncbi:GM24846 [Drosophila sechellia]|uniref:Nibrin n=1 Tax=Drosophila sechellia TaxID=7238 RepID=B4HL99_DROSE|nr:GM24846 [Drosophila sechellia]